MAQKFNEVVVAIVSLACAIIARTRRVRVVRTSLGKYVTQPQYRAYVSFYGCNFSGIEYRFEWNDVNPDLLKPRFVTT